MSWDAEAEELRRRCALAQELGGAERVARHHDDGKLTVRERIERLVDKGSFQEFGALTGAATYVEGRLEKITPAPYVMGLARRRPDQDHELVRQRVALREPAPAGGAANGGPGCRLS